MKVIYIDICSNLVRSARKRCVLLFWVQNTFSCFAATYCCNSGFTVSIVHFFIIIICHLKNWLWAHQFTNLLTIITKFSDCICKFLFLVGWPEIGTCSICTFIFNGAIKLPDDGLITSSFNMFGNFLIVPPVLIQCPIKSLNFIICPAYWIHPKTRCRQFGMSLSLFLRFKE